MNTTQTDPLLGFVWRSEEIGRRVVDLAARSSCRAIFTVQDVTVETAGLLAEAGAEDVLISALEFEADGLDAFVTQSGIRQLWVEYHPAFRDGGLEAFFTRYARLSSSINIIPVTGDWEFILGFLQRSVLGNGRPGTLAIKGAEAAGLTGSETSSILFSTLGEHIKDHRPLEVVIWGGIGTPEGAAAFLACGAKGVVFESLHWQTDGIVADSSSLQRLAKVRPEQTAVVGTELGLSLRVFDKGNSLVLRELSELALALSRKDSIKDAQKEFLARARELTVEALNSELGRNQLIFLGPEASFATWFATEFGESFETGVLGFKKEILARLADREPAERFRKGGEAAARLGTDYPFVQGAMSWISDVPEFALAVSRGGGLPTVALGLRDRDTLVRDLARLGEVMGERPYALNCLALPENPHLEEQLRLLEEIRPPFVVIAAGEPSHAARLIAQGIEVIYIAPEEGLLRLALSKGVRWIVLEGNEAGGHVGALSTLSLAQSILVSRRKEPTLFKDVRIILAGGIHNRKTALWAAMLGADAVQMGTVYLTVEEIVATGALTPLYQKMILEAGPQSTTVSGQSVGLRVRALKTNKMSAILELEKKQCLLKEDESEFRQKMEILCAGSLLVAARGNQHPGGENLSEETCLKEGQFMSGAGCGALTRVRTIGDIHGELAGEKTSSISPIGIRSGSSHDRSSAPALEKERVVITGWAQVNSLGNSPEEIWQAVLAGKSGVTEIPDGKWEHELFFDPTPGTSEKTYCRVGAFQNIQISRKDLGIPPQDFRTMAESTKLTMFLAHEAIIQSGILNSNVPRERIGVVVSQNSGESASTMQDLVVNVSAKRIVHSLRNVLDMTPELELAAERRIKEGRIVVDDTTLLGRLNCAAGGFICNKFGFNGPSYSVTAACATSQVALYTAIQMIRNGILDVAVVGGGEEKLTPAHFVEFSALGALAGLSGAQFEPWRVSRPFDLHRDGMVLGEGGGMIVIERESLARKRGAEIFAYITGVGASNSNQGMVESVAEPQQIAIRASFRDAGYGPETVDLVECHATGTVQGDVQEVLALKGFLPNGRRTMLASFKSQIGHTLGASGMNSLIRGLMALRAGIYPPTLNYEIPDPDIALEDWGLMVPTQPLEWGRNGDRPKRLMTNAFGFGGANYVVQLEECLEDRDTVLVGRFEEPSAEPQKEEPSEENTAPPLGEGVSFLTAELAGRAYRIGVVGPELELKGKMEAVTSLSKDPSAKEIRALARDGVFSAPVDEPAPTLALVFAGQGTVYPGMGKVMYDTFPLMREWMDRIASLAEFDLLEVMFKTDSADLKNTLWQQPALYCLEYAVVQQLLALGVTPAAMAGHSMGELTALAVSDSVTWDEGFHIINKRAQCMDKAAGLSLDPGVMIAVEAPMELLKQKVEEGQAVYFTNFNSPRQVVMGGDTQEVLALMEELKGQGFWAVQLKVSMAFHSPIMRSIRDEMAEFVSKIDFKPPRIPVMSNTTMKPYPDEADEIRKIIMAHLEEPVHWMQNVSGLWEEFGVRDFLEVGPKATLCNLIQDTIEEARCFHVCHPEDEGGTFRTAAAQLFSAGHLNRVKPRSWNPAPTPAPVAQATWHPTAPVALSSDPVAAVIQREINAFVLESFGRFLKPAILNALKREVDPGFSEDRLNTLLSQTIGAAPAAVPVAPPAFPAPPAAAPLKAPPSALKAAAVPAAKAAEPKTSIPKVESSAAAGDDYLERVIQIIMEATGYDRDEIEPEMDIRNDLAIRSSRLPVIMDAAERVFGISVQLEDFVSVRTVQAMADRIREVAIRDGVQSLDQEPENGESLAPIPEVTERIKPEDGVEPKRDSIKRVVLVESSIEASSGRTLEMPSGAKVAVLNLGPGSELARQAAGYWKERFASEVLELNLTQDLDPTRPEGRETLIQELDQAGPLAGIVVVLSESAAETIGDESEVPGVLSAMFEALKLLVRSADKKVSVLVTRTGSDFGPLDVLAEGTLGLFLAAAHEYNSIMFRSVSLDSETDPGQALDRVLDAGRREIQWIFREGQARTPKGVVTPLSGNRNLFELKPESVVLLTGGARGVTARLAEALAPFKPRLILAGRSAVSLPEALEDLAAAGPVDDDTLKKRILAIKPNLADDVLEMEIKKLGASLEAMDTLARLEAMGCAVEYHQVDVADAQGVLDLVRSIVQEHGRIDGLIHGAGIIRDSFLDFMTSDDFNRVMEVKLSGAWNLYQAAKDHELGFLVVLSSIASIQGNPGQANYCAANRAMSALTRTAKAQGIRAKALMLPPIEGTGMADDPELKELFKVRGMSEAWVHVDELAACFCRELFFGPDEEAWVVLGRKLPQVDAVPLSLDEPEASKGRIMAAQVAFNDYDYPMVEQVAEIDLKTGSLTALRTFSLRNDIWVEDHRPFKFLNNAPVSGVMAAETFLEAARVLYPWLKPIGLREVEYNEFLEVPFGVPVAARVRCRTLSTSSKETVVEAVLESQDVNAKGRKLDHWSANFKSRVLLAGSALSEIKLDGFPIQKSELTTEPVGPEDVQRFYEERSSMTGRYRVLERIFGTGPGAIVGSMVYEQGVDFADFDDANYQFPPYVLEGLMHLFPSFQGLQNPEDQRIVIPYRIEEMMFQRMAFPGERLRLEARVVQDDDQTRTWNVCAFDHSDVAILAAKGVVMKWFKE